MDLLTSKKFQAAVIAVVVMVLSKIGLDLNPDMLLAVVSPLIAYILGQGIADHGKERAKIENAQK